MSAKMVPLLNPSSSFSHLDEVKGLLPCLTTNWSTATPSPGSSFLPSKLQFVQRVVQHWLLLRGSWLAFHGCSLHIWDGQGLAPPWFSLSDDQVVLCAPVTQWIPFLDVPASNATSTFPHMLWWGSDSSPQWHMIKDWFLVCQQQHQHHQRSTSWWVNSWHSMEL